jgi:hypothetical protein
MGDRLEGAAIAKGPQPPQIDLIYALRRVRNVGMKN